MLQELTKDRSPILFEGLHTTYFLKDDRLKNQLKLVRTHNIEHEYYYHLALNSTGWKKRYFLSETKKLQKYEPILHHADHILAIKDSDKKYFSQYGKTSVLYPCSEVKNGEKKPTKPYAIFHGNLSVSENERAVKWLIEHIDSTIDLIIAGKNPSSNLKSIIKKKKIRLFENPDKQQMDELIQNARIHLLYTDQSTGVKLKLINALQCSGHILVNDKMVEGTRFDQLCTVLSRKEEWNKKIHELIEKELTTEEFNRRTQFIKNHLICTKSCSIIKNIIQNNL